MKNRMRGTSKLLTKMKTKNVFIFSAFTVAVLGLVTIGIVLYLNLGNYENTYAAGSTYSSVQTGNWTANATWGGSAPATSNLNGDNITINGPHVVTAGAISTDNNVTITIKSGATLHINGNLIVKNNLILNNSGSLVITGNLSADNGAGITINGGGNVKVSGSATFDNNATLLVKGVFQVAGALTFGNNESFSGTGTVLLGSGCAYWDGPGSCSTGALPIKLLSFTAENVKGIVMINWKTAREENNEFFTIERTTDGVNYTAVATLPGAGTTLKVSNYSYQDVSPLKGKSYYRLSQTDFDGRSETFSPVAVDVVGEALGFAIFPNPLKGNVLTVSIPVAKERSLEIISMTGDKVLSKDVNEGENNFQLTLGENLQPGFYYVNYKTAQGVKVAKLLKQ